jgi:hypothetical protein
VLTAEAVASKLADVLPVATFTARGTLSALLLLESVTTVSLVAVWLNETEHATDIGPVSDCFPHATLLSVATGVAGGALGTGFSVRTSVSVTPCASPVIVTLTDLVTASVTALNAAVFCPASTTTEAGNLSAALLLVSDTGVDCVADALR